MDYDIVAEKYECYGNEAVTDWLLGYCNVLSFLKPLKKKVVLDYGCGTGKFCRFIRDRGAKVIGVDISKNMIRVAKKSGSEKIEYYVIKSGCLDFISSNSLDFAVINFVFCTISSSEEIKKIMHDINRCLKKNGKIIILDVNWEVSNGKEFISFKMDKIKRLISGQRVGGLLKSKMPIRTEDYFWSKENHVSMLKKAGFKISDIEEPLALDDSHEWINEKEFSPFLIIVAKK